VDDLAAAGVRERILGGRVELHVQHSLQVSKCLRRRAVYLRQCAQPVGVLNAGRRAGGVRAQKLAQPSGSGGLAWVRPGCLHWPSVRLRGAAQGQVSERGDVQLGVEQPGQVLVRERRLREGHGIGGEERERVRISRGER
jgi:hypothetical protein